MARDVFRWGKGNSFSGDNESGIQSVFSFGGTERFGIVAMAHGSGEE